MECDKEKIRKYLDKINVEYDSPIKLFYKTDNIITQMEANTEQALYQAVCEVGVDIDKDKLESAMRQDRQRYDEAYQKGYRKGYTKREEEIVRCKDCIASSNGSFDYEMWCGITGKRILPNDFCSNGRLVGSD